MEEIVLTRREIRATLEMSSDEGGPMKHFPSQDLLLVHFMDLPSVLDHHEALGRHVKVYGTFKSPEIKALAIYDTKDECDQREAGR